MRKARHRPDLHVILELSQPLLHPFAI